MGPKRGFAWWVGLLGMALAALLTGCGETSTPPAWVPPTAAGGVAVQAAATATRLPPMPPTWPPGVPRPTPTPDPPHPLPTLRAQAQVYTVQPGDTFGLLMRRFRVSEAALRAANPQLTDPNLLTVGMVLTIPAPDPVGQAPNFKIVPDSELVYGPYAAGFDIAGFIQRQGGYLSRYREERYGRVWTGPEIVRYIALNNSVNPRLLLAILEYQSHWVTQAEPPTETLDYPLGLRDPNRKGLFRQLHWLANELNRGYYLWLVNGLDALMLADGRIALPNPQVNAGTAGVHHALATLLPWPAWQRAVGPEGVFATYQRLFGHPFDYAYEPLIPPGLTQPELQLPFEPGIWWYFTGGPHGGWDSGSAWAALDFAPSDIPPGCTISGQWVTAVADGLVVRAEDGVVVLDLDGDGWEQTGWVIFYLHISEQERTLPGLWLRAGDRIGHPSCEGGVSTGTHVHIARKYNGQWIEADGPVPFVMDGWRARAGTRAYDGFLVRGNEWREACAGCRNANNRIRREPVIPPSPPPSP